MSQGFIIKVNKEVDAAMIEAVKVESHTYNGPPAGPYTLEQLLGLESDGIWWRLYIDPKDWNDALKGDKADPGSVYDNQLSQGWQKDLTNVYKRFLNSNSGDYLSLKDLTWTKYNEVWHEATKNVDAKKKERFQSRFEANKQAAGSYPAALVLVTEVTDQAINGRHFVRNGVNDHRFNGMGKTPEGLTAFMYHLDNKTLNRVEPDTNGKVLQDAVDSVFKTFHDSMSKAKTRSAQLEAIAWTIRTLHMLHTWTDGCGRVNVQTLLPVMLMTYGFGLPLGGRFGKKVDRWAQYMMFNGGYTVEQMARYLFVMQDFGLLDLEHSVIKVPPRVIQTQPPVKKPQHKL